MKQIFKILDILKIQTEQVSETPIRLIPRGFWRNDLTKRVSLILDTL